MFIGFEGFKDVRAITRALAASCIAKGPCEESSPSTNTVASPRPEGAR